MGDFKAVLANPDTARMIYLEDLLDALKAAVPVDDAWQTWLNYLHQRYVIP